jgi:hypothetical protein
VKDTPLVIVMIEFRAKDVVDAVLPHVQLCQTAPSLLCHENAARFDAYYLPLGVSPLVAQNRSSFDLRITNTVGALSVVEGVPAFYL